MNIVAEGEYTEPSYFYQINQPNVTVITIGKDDHTCPLVESVDSIKREQDRKLVGKFDEIWVVFDKDDFSDFDAAVQLAGKKYKAAYSNHLIFQ